MHKCTANHCTSLAGPRLYTSSSTALHAKAGSLRSRCALLRRAPRVHRWRGLGAGLARRCGVEVDDHLRDVIRVLAEELVALAEGVLEESCGTMGALHAARSQRVDDAVEDLLRLVEVPPGQGWGRDRDRARVRSVPPEGACGAGNGVYAGVRGRKGA